MLPDRYHPDLAVSLANLSAVLFALDQDGEAAATRNEAENYRGDRA